MRQDWTITVQFAHCRRFSKCSRRYSTIGFTSCLTGFSLIRNGQRGVTSDVVAVQAHVCQFRSLVGLSHGPGHMIERFKDDELEALIEKKETPRTKRDEAQMEAQQPNIKRDIRDNNRRNRHEIITNKNLGRVQRHPIKNHAHTKPRTEQVWLVNARGFIDHRRT